MSFSPYTCFYPLTFFSQQDTLSLPQKRKHSENKENKESILFNIQISQGRKKSHLHRRFGKSTRGKQNSLPIPHLSKNYIKFQDLGRKEGARERAQGRSEMFIWVLRRPGPVHFSDPGRPRGPAREALTGWSFRTQTQRQPCRVHSA